MGFLISEIKVRGWPRREAPLEKNERADEQRDPLYKYIYIYMYMYTYVYTRRRIYYQENMG